MSSIGLRHILGLGRSSQCLDSFSQIINRNSRVQFHATNCQLNENRTSQEEVTENLNAQYGGTSSSHTYRQFHRTAYERKRASYQKERLDHNMSEPLFSHQSFTHYQRLNIDPLSDSSAIKSAYYALSKQYHPDIVGEENPGAAEQFRLITESYDILSDLNLRSEYDKTLTPVTQSSPQHTSWKPSYTTDNDHMQRMREAGRIIKTKQEELLERERARDPQKFRAGVFKSDPNDVYRNSSDEIDKLNKRISSNKVSNFRTSGTDAHSEFYRMHMMDIMQRRKEEWLDSHALLPSRFQDDGMLLGAFLSVVGALILAIVLIVNTILDLDVAGYLDDRIERKLSEIKADTEKKD